MFVGIVISLSRDDGGDLAILLNDQGRMADAEALYREVIAGRTAQLGESHTDTLRTKGNFGDLLRQQERLSELGSS